MKTFGTRSGTRRLALLAFAAVLSFVLAGCQRPAFLDAKLPDDGAPIQTTPQAALRFVEKITDAGDAATKTKGLSLTVTQQEVTSFLNIGGIMADQMHALNVDNLAELQNVNLGQGLDGIEGLDKWQALLNQHEGLSNLSLSDLSLRVLIREPEVYFKADGRLIIRGYAEALGQRQPLRLVFAPKASEGELVLDFVEGNLGPVEVPELLIDQIGKGLARAILAGQEYIEVSQIRVSDGSLSIAGRYTGP